MLLLDQLQGNDIDTPKTLAYRYIEQFPKHLEYGDGLFLHSIRNGNGKTALARAIMEKLAIEPYYIVNNRPISPSHGEIAFSDIVRASWFSEEFKKMTSLVESKTLLLIDDVSKWTATSNAHEDASRLIRFLKIREDLKLPVFITTNFKPEDFAKQFGVACWSLINGHCQQIEFTGKDYRGESFSIRKSEI